MALIGFVTIFSILRISITWLETKEIVQKVIEEKTTSIIEEITSTLDVTDEIMGERVQSSLTLLKKLKTMSCIQNKRIKLS